MRTSDEEVPMQGMGARRDTGGVVFRDRVDAGRRLAAALGREGWDDAVVLGLPRGGVPVAAEVAAALHAPLDVVLVRKLGLPGRPELAMGAIGEDGVRVLDRDLVRRAGVTAAQLAAVERRERAELERRTSRYRDGRPMTPVEGRTAIIVDDGIATGATARAACAVVRAHGARRIVLAAPVAAPESAGALLDAADEVVCVVQPHHLLAVGEWYADFAPTSDDEVVRLLGAARPPVARAALPRGEVELDLDGARLPGHLAVPPDPSGLVLFAHGSGSSRHSPRNRAVAELLGRAGMATLLFDLLTAGEEPDRANVFDVELLGRRLVAATRWLRRDTTLDALPVGYFGASTGGAAALWAASQPGLDVSAVVVRGGRPDLAGSRLQHVAAPTLLIVGGDDPVVLELNRRAARLLRCEHRLAVVPGATHLFEEPGALGQVGRLAADWFAAHLGGPGRGGRGA